MPEDTNDDLAAVLDDPIATDTPEEGGLNPTGDLMDDFIKDLAGGDAPADSDKQQVDGEEDEEETDDAETEEETEESEETEEEETETEEETEESEESDEDDDVSEDPPKGASKKASEDWKKLRGSRDKYKTQAAELENVVKERETKLAEMEAKVAELEELRGKAALSDEIQDKLKNYEELEKTVAMLRVEESPEYKKAVSEPLNTIEEQVIALGKENEADLSAIFDAVNEPDLAAQRKKLKEATAGWDEIDKVELRNMAADARVLFGKQREMRENASVAAKQREELSKAEAEQAAATAKKEFLDATKVAVESIKEKMPFVPLRDGETVEDRYAALSEKLKNVDFDTQSAQGKAVAAAAAIELPKAIQVIDKLRKEVSALEARLDKKDKAKPSSSPKEKKPEPEEEDFFDGLGIPQDPLISERLMV